MKSHRAKLLAVLGLAFGFSFGSIGQTATVSPYEQQLQEVPQGPIQLRRLKGMSWAEYCPDETCDVIRTRDETDKTRFAGTALAYFFYVSNYSYLKSWKESEPLKRQVDAFLESQDTGMCSASDGRARSICILRSLADAVKLEILSVRHDERRTGVQRLSRSEIFK